MFFIDILNVSFIIIIVLLALQLVISVIILSSMSCIEVFDVLRLLMSCRETEMCFVDQKIMRISHV